MIDSELIRLIRMQEEYETRQLRLIPSENYVSRSVRDATGSILMNKYSEGYPGRRYYQGLGIIDDIERLGIERAKLAFRAEHANLQPYSGSIAVLASYLAVVKPGARILGPKLAHGGHLSHGHGVNISGVIFEAAQYGVSEQTENFDFGEISEVARLFRPQIIVAGGTAFPRQIDFSEFGRIARDVGAVLIADISHIAGLIVAGVHPDPFPHADIVVTTSHKTLRGPRGAIILSKEERAAAVDRAVFPLLQGGPHQHTQAGISTALFEAMQPSFKSYSKQVVINAKALGDGLANEGIRLVTGGTDTHLILADVRDFGIDGKAAAVALERADIVVNANMIPFDPGTAARPSGVRIGSPAVTTRGMNSTDMNRIATLISRVLKAPDDEGVLTAVKREVHELTDGHPVPDHF